MLAFGLALALLENVRTVDKKWIDLYIRYAYKLITIMKIRTLIKTLPKANYFLILMPV